MTLNEMRIMRENKGISYSRLSGVSKVAQITIQKIFSGVTRNPRKATMDAIEKALVEMDPIYETGANDKAGLYDSFKEDTYRGTAMVQELDAYLASKEPGEYTLDDYYALPDERRVELIDGVFYDMPSPSVVHQDIAFYIHISFYLYIKEKKKPCKVFEAPLDVQILKDNRNMLQPDVLVVCERDRIKGFGIYGAPDFVLEILSKSTRKKDMTIKLEKYIDAGVREYWIIDPFKEVLITYDLSDDTYIPVIHTLDEKVPVVISNGELMIDMAPVADSIREFGEENT